MFFKSKIRKIVSRKFGLPVKHPSQKLSFSQSGEDMIMKYICNCINIEKPSYIDIGACDPFLFNNTASFYFSGSRGINIEPNPDLYKELCIQRPEDVNLNIGISDEENILDFYILSNNLLNTFEYKSAKEISLEANVKIERIEKIKVDTLCNIIKKHNNNIFPDILDIDAESFEEKILRSIDFEKQCPKIICMESISYSETGRGEKNSDLIEYIKGKGYLLYADTNINSIFVKKDLWIR
ncbi:MAG: FkbM family methyltransferase [Bacteroidales bacterium]|nr:FkbM family methyltransferase [Bacteroidales bacterium]